jgi:hypothetical protein
MGKSIYELGQAREEEFLQEPRLAVLSATPSPGLQDTSDLVDEGMQRVRLLNEARDIGAGKPIHRGFLGETR